MAEPTQKEMLTTLVRDVKSIKAKQDSMKSTQDDMDDKLNNIEIELGGTTMEPGRGLVPRLIQAEKCISTIKKKQFKIFTWAIVIAVGVNVLWQGIRTFLIMIKG